jgi:tetratricopeptide (TPR) repeat protein
MNADHPQLLTIQPVFPYFLKTKLNQLDGLTREALAEGFKNHYQGLAGYYRQLMQSKEAQARQTGILFCQLEYENLYNALQIALAKQEIPNIWQCLGLYLGLLNNPKEELGFYENLCSILMQRPLQSLPESELEEIIRVLGQRANAYYKNKDYELAKPAYQAVLDLLRQASVSPELNHTVEAAIYHQLGMVAQELRGFEEAKRNYQQALQIFIDFNDRFSQASTYHQLGRVAQELREFDEAKRYYQQAIQIYIDFNDRFSQASTYHQLGIVAQELREFDEAKRYYQQALQIYIDFNDRFSQASTYHQLGSVAQELREFEEAKRHYQQALQIKIDFNDRFSQARTYYHLAQVAEALEDLEEAKAYYLQDLQITAEFNDEHGLGISLRNLARFYQATQDEAFLATAAVCLGATVAELKAAILSE